MAMIYKLFALVVIFNLVDDLKLLGIRDSNQSLGLIDIQDMNAQCVILELCDVI